MKAKIIAVGAPEHLINFSLKSNVDRVLCLLDHGVKNHEPAPIFQNAKHFFHHSFGIVKVMQTKRHKGAIERFRFKRQSVGFTGALIVGRNRIYMLVADVEHGERLINADHLATLETLRHRSSHSTGPSRHIENPLIALQDEHFNQLLGKIVANLRSTAIKFRRVLRIMEMRLVPVAMTMPMFVIVLVTVPVLVVMGVFVSVIVCVGIVFVTVIMNVRMAVAMLVTMVVVMIMLFVIMLMFVLPFVAHRFIVPSSRSSSASEYARIQNPQPLKVVYLASYLIKPASFKFDPKLRLPPLGT